MIDFPKRYLSKKGNVILIVIGVLIVLLVFLSTFLKSTTSRTHTTKKLGDTMHARELANSLAVVAFHCIKNIELRNEGSALRKALATPMPLQNDESGDLIESIKTNVTDASDNIIEVLLKNSGLNEIKIDELSWKIYKDDFEILKIGNNDSPFPREKKGFIKVYIKISYKLPGQKNTISEDYLFASQINVVANLLPVLSKFNLYIKDAFGGSRPNDDDELASRFNIVSTTAGGAIKNDSQACPWILNNGDSDKQYDRYEKYVESPKGLIYIGGGEHEHPVILGIARGFTDVTTGPYSEDFHFYKRGSGGYWKTYDVWDNNVGILAAEIGLCDDDSTNNLKIWQKMFGNAYKNQSKKNSIFRLLGTDESISPTLVLGYVDSMFGQVRLYKGSGGSDDRSFLAYFDRFDDFKSFTGLSYSTDSDEIDGTVAAINNELSLRGFASAYITKKNTSFDNSDESQFRNFYEEYKEKYSTRIVKTRYNKDATYLLARNNATDEDSKAYPLNFGNVIQDANLLKLCKSQKDDIFEAIPTSETVKYKNIYSNAKLSELDKLFDSEDLYINNEDASKNDRIAHKYILNSQSEDEVINLKKYLIAKSLLQGNITANGSVTNGKLDLNGWLHIECDIDQPVDINLDKIKNLSQGGIVVSNKNNKKVNITIDNDITGEHFTIITLNGDIIIKNGAKKIDASLIAINGQIKLDSNQRNEQEVTINGNKIMKKIDKNTITSSFKRKLILKYKEALAAKPYQTNKTPSDEELKRSEYPMLMFDLKDSVKKLD